MLSTYDAADHVAAARIRRNPTWAGLADTLLELDDAFLDYRW